MALLYSDHAVFYHPCDTAAEKLHPHNWTGSGYFLPGQVGSGIAPSATLVSGVLTQIDADTCHRAVSTLLEQSGAITRSLVCWYQPGGFKIKVIQVSGTQIEQGNETNVETTTALNDVQAINVTALTPTKALVVYGATGPNRGACRVVTVSGLTPTVEAANTFNTAAGGRNGAIWQIAVDRLDDDTAFVVFSDYSNSFGIESMIVRATGTSPICATIKKVSNDPGAYTRVACLGPTSGVVAWRNTALGEGHSRTFGTYGANHIEHVYVPGVQPFTEYASTDRPMAGLLDESHAVAIFTHDNRGSMKIITFDGTTASLGSGHTIPYQFHINTMETADKNVAALTPSSFVVVGYSNLNFQYTGRAFACDWSGSQITLRGADAAFEPNSNPTGVISCLNVGAINSSGFLVAYRQGHTTQPAGNSGVCVVGTVGANNAITYGTRAPFASGVRGLSMDVLSSNSGIVSYRDHNDGSKVKVCLATIDGTTISYTTPIAVASGWSGTDYLNRTKIVALSPSSAVLLYPDTNVYGTAVPLSISGTTIASGAAFTIDATTTYLLGGCRVSPSSLATSYIIGVTGPTGVFKRVRVLTLNEGTLSLTASGYADTGPYTYVGITGTDDAPVIMTTSDGNLLFVTSDTQGMLRGGVAHSVVRPASISGGSVVFGPQVEFGSYGDANTDFGLKRLSSSRALVAYSAVRWPDENTQALSIGTATANGVEWGTRFADTTIASYNLTLTTLSSLNTGASGETIATLSYNRGSAPAQSESRLIFSRGDTVSGTIPAAFFASATLANLGATPLDNGRTLLTWTSGNNQQILSRIMTPDEFAGFITPSGSSYLSCENSSHFAIACWLQRPSPSGTWVEIGRGYYMRIRPDKIELSTYESSPGFPAEYLGENMPGLLAALNDGNRHFLAADFENTGDGQGFYLKTSLDGAPWLVQGSHLGAPVLPQDEDQPPTIRTSGVLPTGTRVIDEVAMWSEAPTFTDDDLKIMYRTGLYGHGLDDPVNIYASGLMPLVTKGKGLASGELPLVYPRHTYASGRLPLSVPKTYGVASGGKPLVMDGHLTSSGDMPLYTVGPLGVSGDVPLFTHGFDLASGVGLGGLYWPSRTVGNAPLFLKVPEPASGRLPIFTEGFLFSSGDMLLFTEGAAVASGSMPLFVSGVFQFAWGELPLLAPSYGIAIGTTVGGLFNAGTDLTYCVSEIPLFMEGSSSAGDFSVEELLRTGDHFPAVIGRLNCVTPETVYIEVWELTNSGAQVAITNSGCYPIGNTGRWAWSTQNLPEASGTHPLYYYRMTSSADTKFEGQFFMNHEYGRRARKVTAVR